ncbi:unnamed protein product [Commensalibacter communis]|uniref:hypothetical protein n=1 Tax=Commensalibacter communis TaxID=2972786 RepID=UPI0022FF803E|nr:hypothetical protein [Commensalibacter communis]CAI3942395.1 unnamed protein product [Commensalibacter communis]
MFITGHNFTIEIYKNLLLSEQDDIEFYLHYKGKVYFGWAFTIKAIYSIMEKDKHTGESANGNFFWATDMIIVREMNEKILLETINHIINKEPELVDHMFSIIK